MPTTAVAHAPRTKPPPYAPSFVVGGVRCEWMVMGAIAAAAAVVRAREEARMRQGGRRDARCNACIQLRLKARLSA
eukprot:2466153-Rhodomonas_salina.2